MLGASQRIKAIAEAKGLELEEMVDILDRDHVTQYDLDKYSDLIYSRMNRKGISRKDAE